LNKAYNLELSHKDKGL